MAAILINLNICNYIMFPFSGKRACAMMIFKISDNAKLGY